MSAKKLIKARHGELRVSRLSRERLLVLDVLRLAAGQCTVHGLIEADVTGLRDRMTAAPGRPTMTGLVTAAVARTVAACPEVNVRRAGRRVVAFGDVAVVVSVEKEVASGLVPVLVPILAAADKSAAAITAELRAARAAKLERPGDLAGLSVLGVLPAYVRRVGARLLGRFPSAAARFGPPVGVSSLGMFGSGWGIPLSPLTLLVTLGGTTKRVVLGGSGPEEREYLPLTLSFDHTVIDGAPAARFATQLRATLEAETRLDSTHLLVEARPTGRAS